MIPLFFKDLEFIVNEKKNKDQSSLLLCPAPCPRKLFCVRLRRTVLTKFLYNAFQVNFFLFLFILMEFKGHINCYSYTSSSATKREGKNFQVDISDFLNVISGCMEEESLQDHVRRRHYNNNNKEKSANCASYCIFSQQMLTPTVSKHIIFFLPPHTYIFILKIIIYIRKMTSAGCAAADAAPCQH